MAMKLLERFLELAHIRKKSRLSRGTRLLYIRIKRRKRRMEKVLAKTPVPAIPSPSSDLPDTPDVS